VFSRKNKIVPIEIHSEQFCTCLQKMAPDVRIRCYAIFPITELRAAKSRCMHLHARMQESSWINYYAERKRERETCYFITFE